MADQGHVLTDKKLKELERKIAAEYRQANKDVAKKLEDYLLKTEAQRQVQEKLLNAGKITQKEYSDWCFRHTMMGKRWEEMRDVLAADYHHANEVALKMAKGEMPDIFALNGNYATFQLEHDGKIDTGFTLYNHDTAEYLLKEDRELMPGPSTRKAREIAANKDMQWNKQKIQSAVLQGVLQGESPYDVASRLQSVGQMNYNASVRYARTMTTNAQNAGRYEAYRRATNLGVDLVIEWQATLDGRTRHEHRMMHGQRRNVDEPFEVSGIKIMWPGNDKCGSSTVPQQLIWNCRCTLLSWVKGFEGDTVKKSPKMGDMTFEEWQDDKKGFTKKKDQSKVQSEATVSDFVKRFERYNPEELQQLGISERTRDDIRYAIAGMEENEAEVWKSAIESTEYIPDSKSFYDPIMRETHIEKDITGRGFLHETAHAIDEGSVHVKIDEWYSVDSASAYLQELVEQAEQYGKAVPDVVTFCNKLGIDLNERGDWLSGEADFIPKYSRWAKAFVKEHDEEHFRSVSDFIDGLTLGEMEIVTQNYGYHGKDYYQKPHGGVRGSPQYDEQWAHYCALRAEHRTDELALLKEVAPNRIGALETIYRMVFQA